jgi:hypothetical protein
MAGKYLVVDIGCLECYHSSYTLGRYKTVAAAMAAHPGARLDTEIGTWKGEHVVTIFDITKVTNPYTPRAEQS